MDGTASNWMVLMPISGRYTNQGRLPSLWEPKALLQAQYFVIGSLLRRNCIKAHKPMIRRKSFKMVGKMWINMQQVKKQVNQEGGLGRGR